MTTPASATMWTLAILPVKRFEDAKRRLRPALDPSARRALAEAMYLDVLGALGRATAIDRTLVVSADERARRIAREHGALVAGEARRGLNSALAAGARHAGALGASRALCVAGDLPLLDPGELDALLGGGALPAPGVVVVPDRHGTGTNALLLSPPDAIAPSFGPDSLGRHRRLAAAQGRGHAAAPLASLALDVDTPDDLAELRRRLAAGDEGAAHTRALVAAIGGPAAARA